jgi:drug/metabolite transporter (DMT)-like permease
MRAAFLALLAALLFGASTPASKWLLGDVAPWTLAGLLYLGAALGTAPAWLVRRGAVSAAIGRASRSRLAAAIAAGGVAGPVLLLEGLARSQASSVSLLLNLELVATAVLGAWLFRDPLGPRGWLGVAGAVAAGAIVTAGEGWPGVSSAAFVAAACVCWGLDNHWTARIDGLSPAQSTFWKGAVAGTTNLAIAASLGALSVPPATAAIALGVGALAYGVSVALYIASAQELGATRAQALFATAPFAGAALAWTALGEPVTASHLAGAALLAASVAVLLRARHEHPHHHDALEHVHSHRHDDGHHDHAHEGIAPAPRHSHWHRHEPRTHAHPHWPDLHHRHGHRSS